MSCPALAQLAACAAEGDPQVMRHAAGCLRCAALLEAQRDAVALVQRAAAPATLGGARRAELAAEVLARAEAEPRPHRGGWIAVGASLAAAAAILLALFASGRSARESRPVRVASRPGETVHDLSRPRPPGRVLAGVAPAATPPAPAATPPDPAATPRDPAAATPPDRAAAPHLAATGSAAIASSPATAAVGSREAHAGSDAPPPAEVVATAGDLTRATFGGVDTIAVRDGELSIDATDRAPVSVTTRTTTVQIAQARAELVAHGGVIVSMRVFAGSVEITSGGTRQVIEAGEVWTPPPGPATSLAAFRAGWEALHAGHDADAIAAFDRATDPVVAEDAAFWAAIAAVRAGDPAEAARRLRAFLAHFPQSPRAADARAALARVR